MACSENAACKPADQEEALDFGPPIPKINVPIICILGGPGSGKGTQCKLIIEKYGITHISTGDLLRDAVKSGSEEGAKIEAIMKDGKLVTIDIVFRLLKKEMERQLGCTKGFILDGFPRERKQGELFESTVAPISLILFLEAPDEILLKRLRNRALTSDRPDDNEETMQKRLLSFNSHKDEVRTLFPQKTKSVDVSGDVEPIFCEISSHLDPLFLTNL